MKGLKLNLSIGRSSIVLEKSEGFDLTVQNALVNLGQRLGSSSMFPRKGTDLLKHSVTGAVVDLNSANHIGGVAAVDTLYFLRAHELPNLETIKEMSLTLDTSDAGQIKYAVSITSTLDRTLGIQLT